MKKPAAEHEQRKYDNPNMLHQKNPRTNEQISRFLSTNHGFIASSIEIKSRMHEKFPPFESTRPECTTGKPPHKDSTEIRTPKQGIFLHSEIQKIASCKATKAELLARRDLAAHASYPSAYCHGVSQEKHFWYSSSLKNRLQG